MTRRQRQLNEAIRREVSALLLRRVNDPRIKGIVTVTEADISPDFKEAKIFISTMGSEEENAETFQGLNAASNFIRRELGARLKLRHTPRIEFKTDDSIKRGSHLIQVIDQIATNHDE
ncbi:MAG: 30S ribosome-binding factor RbfA [Dehalococcoidia bacterium]